MKIPLHELFCKEVPVGTLADYKSRPLTCSIDFSAVNVTQVAFNKQEIEGYLLHHDDKIKATPEHDALSFYLLNHAMGLIYQRYDREEPLGLAENIVSCYYDKMNAKVLRAFYYLLLICTRESRHVYNNKDLFAKLEKQYPGCMAFTLTILQCGSHGAVSTFLSDPPNATLGAYTNHLVDIFLEGSYAGGYGGKAWSNVAKCLRDYVHGTLTGEMLLDVIWTLCHNGGPIFNKGMMYGPHNSSELMKILDVQRSGQIPQLIANKESFLVADEHTYLSALCCEALGPEAFSGYVDWYKVEALGSLHKYSSLKKAQVDLYGLPATATQSDKLVMAQVKLKAIEDQKKADEFAEHYFEVMPNVVVSKIVRNTGAV